ncbi:hypothetical protein SAMN05421510_11181, partial [Nitrosomonas ureae]
GRPVSKIAIIVPIVVLIAGTAAFMMMRKRKTEG